MATPNEKQKLRKERAEQNRRRLRAERRAEKTRVEANRAAAIAQRAAEGSYVEPHPNHTKLNLRHQTMVREKIRASQLINVLQDHAFDIKKIKDPTRIKAIQILLNKSIPDLNRTEIVGDPDAPLNTITITTTDPVEAGRQYQRMVNGDVGPGRK